MPKTVKGALGGTIGGFVGGAGFDLIGSFSQSGLASRLIGFCIIGLAIGFVLSLVTGRGLRSVLYGVTPTDAATYAQGCRNHLNRAFG